MSGAIIFCARCDEWLPDPEVKWHPRGRLRGLSPERKWRRLRTLEALSALAAVAAAVVAFAVRAGADHDLLIVSMLLCLVVVAWQAVAFFIGRSIQGGRSRGTAEDGTALPAAQRDARPTLDAADTGGLVRPPSVTDNTTALLDPVKKGGQR